MFALEELLLLVPQNSFHVLQHAEALYSAGEPARAYKSYLRTLEMCGVVSEGGKAAGGGTREGPWVRALWGLKAVSARTTSRVEGACMLCVR